MLDLLADGEVRDTVWLRDQLAKHFNVSSEERAQLLPKGTGRLFDNRVAWAYTHLFHALAIERPLRANYRITPRGLKLLDENPDRIDVKVLSQFPELVEFRKGGGKGPRRKVRVREPMKAVEAEQSPIERMAEARADHEAELAFGLLERIHESDPAFFERLVLKVLVAMGYGGSEEEAAQHLGGVGDEGVDGVIYEDRLGLDRIYVQAKRLTENAVGRPEIQRFVGALDGKGANKGVFITASRFARDAQEWADRLARSVVLIDGDRLASLMIRYGVGVTARETFAVQEIDEDFFTSELG
jgi:restriction system protein